MKRSFTRPSIKNFPNISWGITSPNSEDLILKWGENPFSPPAQVKKDIIDSLIELNRYPILMETLKQELAAYVNLPVSFICLTNGADKAFRLLAETFIDPGDVAITFTPSYPVVNSAVELMGGKMVPIALNENFHLPNLAAIKKQITPQTKFIYICNPNNPTGNLVANLDQIEQLLKLKTLVIVDEAYFETSLVTFAPLVRKYRNLIILRSFSKGFALAGLRVGYILAAPSIIKDMQTVEETLEIFNISTPSLAGAISALRNRAVYQPLFKQLNETKKSLQTELQKIFLKGDDSLTTFMLFDIRSTGFSTQKFCRKMALESIFVKDCSIYPGLNKWKVYTAIPAPSDLPRFVQAVKKIISRKDK